MAVNKPLVPQPKATTRTPSKAVKSPMPKVIGTSGIKTPMPKGITVAIRKGVTMDLKTGVKTTAKATPKPIKTKSDAQYLSDQKKFIASQKKSK